MSRVLSVLFTNKLSHITVFSSRYTTHPSSVETQLSVKLFDVIFTSPLYTYTVALFLAVLLVNCELVRFNEPIVNMAPPLLSAMFDVKLLLSTAAFAKLYNTPLVVAVLLVNVVLFTVNKL